tara:strand:+ start:1009 stop:1155 length:147 start_codon:yes stop_codon:yes gene_type:complete
MIGDIIFLLLVLFLFYPMVYFFISKDNNKIQQNIDEYERKNKKLKETR